MLHVLKTVFHLKSKQECPKKGHAIEYFRPKWPKPACACPFLGHSCFEFKCFAHFGTTHILPPVLSHVLISVKHLKSKQECPKKGHASI